MVWKMMMFEEFQIGCLVLGNLCHANGILAISESKCCQKPPIKFLLKRIWLERRCWLKNIKMAD